MPDEVSVDSEGLLHQRSQMICVCKEDVCQITESNEPVQVGSGSDDGIATETADHIKGAVCLNKQPQPAS